MNTSEVLYRAADLIEERGWVGGDDHAFNPWGGGEGVPLCMEGAIVEAYGEPSVRKTEFANLCPAGRAVRAYLGMADWKEGTEAPHLYRFNDTEGRTATEVIEVLRACAVIEAAKENAMSAFSGAQGKGAMRRRRDKKRTEAEARNAVEVRVYKCGHVSSRFDHPCWQAAS